MNCPIPVLYRGEKFTVHENWKVSLVEVLQVDLWVLVLNLDVRRRSAQCVFGIWLVPISEMNVMERHLSEFYCARDMIHRK